MTTRTFLRPHDTSLLDAITNERKRFLRNPTFGAHARSPHGVCQPCAHAGSPTSRIARRRLYDAPEDSVSQAPAIIGNSRITAQRVACASAWTTSRERNVRQLVLRPRGGVRALAELQFAACAQRRTFRRYCSTTIESISTLRTVATTPSGSVSAPRAAAPHYKAARQRRSAFAALIGKCMGTSV